MGKLENFIRPSILDLQPYSSARDEFKGLDGVFLDANENPYGTLNRYPDPNQTILKQKLADLKGVAATHIFVGNGSDEIIDLAFRIVCNPKDKALTFSPTYGMYAVSAAINSVPLLTVPLNDSFQIDLDRLTPYLADPTIKLLFICSPNNPTGNSLDRNAIEFILQNFKGLVVVDEAYIDFTETPSLINLISEYPNLVVSQTFSKAWGLAGARIGIAYANAELISIFNKIKPPYNVSVLNQQAAIRALDNYDTYKEQLAAILLEKERLSTALLQSKSVKKIYPSDANFLLIVVDHADQLYQDLVEQQIITRNRTTQVANCLRITVGTPDENNALINALKI